MSSAADNISAAGAFGATPVTGRTVETLPGEEDLRFIRNFHDVFLSIGLAMFGVGLGLVTVLVVGPMGEANDWRSKLTLLGGAAALNAVVMWALAEFFARGRRLFLPAIVTLIGFLWFLSAATFAFFLRTVAEVDIPEWREAVEQFKLLPLTVTGVATLGALGYYARMKLPFAMGVSGVGIVSVAVAAFFYANPDFFLDEGRIIERLRGIQLLGGLFLFGLGVWFDARDPQRRTRISDNGFWLHFFAAPLIFTSVTASVAGSTAPFNGGTYPAAATLAVVVAFAIVSLLINRRALLVAGLLSAAASIGVLVSQAGLDAAWTAGLTLLLLGGAMVLLGGGWHTVRRALVAPFPKTGLIARIIPPEPDKNARKDDE